MYLRRWTRRGAKAARLHDAIERFGPRLTPAAPLMTRLPNGCTVLCDNFADPIQRQIYFHGAFEAVEAYLFWKMLRPGMTVIDAGAHIGQYTLLAATAVGPLGLVHSFEPVPSTFARLWENVTRSAMRNITINRAALWHERSTVTLKLPTVTAYHSGTWSIGSTDSQTSPEKAETIALDDYAAQHGLTRVDVIKMDIEGAEPFAIAGGRELIERSRPTFFMEVNRMCLGQLGGSPESLWRELSALGYRAWRIGWSLGDSGPIPSLDKVDFGNFIFHHDALPPDITGGWDRHTPRRWACSGW
jgi:FkbM family methyltransferase